MPQSTPQHLNRPRERDGQRSRFTPAPRGSRHRNPLPRRSPKGPVSRPASLLPTVLVTGLALGALLWGVPGADGGGQPQGRSVAMPVLPG